MKDKLDTFIGVAAFVAGLIGIGYAIGTRSKMNNLCQKLDVSIGELTNDLEVDIPEKLVKRAVEDAVRREASIVVKRATDEVIGITEREIRKEVLGAVDIQRNSIGDMVTSEIAQRVSQINEGQLRKEVVEKAKSQIADKFDDKLDDLLEDFNGNLQNVGRIYKSIAKSFSKEDI